MTSLEFCSIANNKITSLDTGQVVIPPVLWSLGPWSWGARLDSNKAFCHMIITWHSYKQSSFNDTCVLWVCIGIMDTYVFRKLQWLVKRKCLNLFQFWSREFLLESISVLKQGILGWSIFGLRDFTLSNTSVKTLCNVCFTGFKSVLHIARIHNNITSIEINVFQNMISLKSIVIVINTVKIYGIFLPWE